MADINRNARPTSSESAAGNKQFRRMVAAARRRGLSSPQIPLAVPEGGPRGAPPRPKISTISMRPPQMGYSAVKRDLEEEALRFG
jgi:hypothetical protein